MSEREPDPTLPTTPAEGCNSTTALRGGPYVVTDILKTPGSGMLGDWQSVWGYGQFGSAGCGQYCLNWGRQVYPDWETIHEGALIIVPGYDLGTCISSRGDCSLLDWGLGILGTIPGEKVVALGVKATFAAVVARRVPNPGASGQLHHICTNKNCVSAAEGGPWTPRFEAIFERAGMNLDDSLNKVRVLGHVGPHPQAYHQAVYDRLISATDGLSGGAYRQALQTELRAIGEEAATPGSVLNNLLVK